MRKKKQHRNDLCVKQKFSWEYSLSSVPISLKFFEEKNKKLN